MASTNPVVRTIENAIRKAYDAGAIPAGSISIPADPAAVSQPLDPVEDERRLSQARGWRTSSMLGTGAKLGGGSVSTANLLGM